MSFRSTQVVGHCAKTGVARVAAAATATTAAMRIARIRPHPKPPFFASYGGSSVFAAGRGCQRVRESRRLTVEYPSLL